jgi:hypothetical protein
MRLDNNNKRQKKHVPLELELTETVYFAGNLGYHFFSGCCILSSSIVNVERVRSTDCERVKSKVKGGAVIIRAVICERGGCGQDGEGTQRVGVVETVVSRRSEEWHHAWIWLNCHTLSKRLGKQSEICIRPG